MGKGKVKFTIINHIFIRMDNAYHHFKTTGDVYFVTNLFKERKMEEPTTTIMIMCG